MCATRRVGHDGERLDDDVFDLFAVSGDLDIGWPGAARSVRRPGSTGSGSTSTWGGSVGRARPAGGRAARRSGIAVAAALTRAFTHPVKERPAHHGHPRRHPHRHPVDGVRQRHRPPSTSGPRGAARAASSARSSRRRRTSTPRSCSARSTPRPSRNSPRTCRSRRSPP